MQPLIPKSRGAFAAQLSSPQPLPDSAQSRYPRNDPLDGLALLHSSIDEWQVRYDLRRAEADILAGACRGESREQAAARRRSSPLTIKVHVTNLLRKTGDTSLHHAVERLLRELVRIPELSND